MIFIEGTRILTNATIDQIAQVAAKLFSEIYGAPRNKGPRIEAYESVVQKCVNISLGDNASLTLDDITDRYIAPAVANLAVWAPLRCKFIQMELPRGPDMECARGDWEGISVRVCAAMRAAMLYDDDLNKIGYDIPRPVLRFDVAAELV